MRRLRIPFQLSGGDKITLGTATLEYFVTMPRQRSNDEYLVVIADARFMAGRTRWPQFLSAPASARMKSSPLSAPAAWVTSIAGRDTRLGRTVAIKLLNAELSGDAGQPGRASNVKYRGASRPSPILTSAPCTTSAITKATRSS